MKKILAVMIGFALAFCIVTVSFASVVTSLPDGTVVAIPAVNYFGGGPQSVGPGITWSSDNTSDQGGSVFGYTDNYGYNDNGYWYGLSMAGLNASYDAYGTTHTMTFAFSSPVSAVGGFLNYVPYGSTDTIISVYDAQMSLIESYTLDFIIGNAEALNAGFFYGFRESSAIISYFTLTDNYIGITDLTIVSGNNENVPEPASMLLLGLGLIGLAGYRKGMK